MSERDDTIGCWTALAWYAVGLCFALGSQVVAGFMLHDAWSWFITPWAGIAAPGAWLLIGALAAFAGATSWAKGTEAQGELTRTLVVRAVGRSVGWFLGRLLLWAMLWAYHAAVIA